MEPSRNHAESLDAQDLVQEHNNLYLATALEWLKLRLRRLARSAAVLASIIPAKSAEGQTSSFVATLFWLQKRPGGDPALPALGEEVSVESVLLVNMNRPTFGKIIESTVTIP